MKLAEKAWGQSLKVIEAIKAHPFNQELMGGSLALERFMYYVEQDSLYLLNFAKCLAIIAAKVPAKHMRCFLNHSDAALVAEQEIVHQYFKKKFNFKETRALTPATLSYINYLLNVCSSEPMEVGIAAITPCFWIYREVGLFIAKQSKKGNPYARWIATYGGESFSRSTDEIIDIFNEVAETSTDEIRDKMLDAFYKSTCLEWHFWNDAYNKKAFDDCYTHESKLDRVSE
jgi:thiaminase/transcriptional activator TenA